MTTVTVEPNSSRHPVYRPRKLDLQLLLSTLAGTVRQIWTTADGERARWPRSERSSSFSLHDDWLGRGFWVLCSRSVRLGGERAEVRQ